jgi:hypothetical protein
MRFPSRRIAFFALVASIALSGPEFARADWPSSPTVNLPVCTATNMQNSVQVTTDMAGGAFLFWQDLRAELRRISTCSARSPAALWTRRGH